MKAVLLLLFASCSAFSQIPHSGEKSDLQLVVPKFHGSQLLPGSLYKVLEMPEVTQPTENERPFNYQMPVKEVTSDGYAMPIKKVIPFDEMNTDFYFDKKRQLFQT
ncbi:MAG: hypothetical protein ACI9V1_002132 [Spirosomataceae bacterium]|jgi:hypothetical protein